MAILGTACMADKVHKHGEYIQQCCCVHFTQPSVHTYSMHLVTCYIVGTMFFCTATYNIKMHGCKKFVVL